MWREIDDRISERDRPEPSRGSRAGVEIRGDETSADPRDALTRHLDLPRGPGRERVRVRQHEYRLSGNDVRTLATVGAFRVVPGSDLREANHRTPTRPARDLERLRGLGLVRTMPYVVGRRRTTVVTLTDRGRRLLEEHRKPQSDGRVQAFYSGICKPRELAHDTRVYAAYVRAAERLSERGSRVRRVVLESELKSSYQRFLQAANRGRRDATGEPERDQEAIARWALEHQLPFHDGHVEFPDLRLEYEDRDGRGGVEDIEIVTPHYRGAHAAAKVRAGFGRYRAVGARLGGAAHAGRGGRGPDPRLAEELLS